MGFFYFYDYDHYDNCDDDEHCDDDDGDDSGHDYDVDDAVCVDNDVESLKDLPHGLKTQSAQYQDLLIVQSFLKKKDVSPL